METFFCENIKNSELRTQNSELKNTRRKASTMAPEFIIHHSSFCILHSAFCIPKSLFHQVRWGGVNSEFRIQNSELKNTRRKTSTMAPEFIIHHSSFCILHSSFCIPKSLFHQVRWGGVNSEFRIQN